MLSGRNGTGLLNSRLCSIMSDVGDNNFVRYIYRGEEDEDIFLTMQLMSSYMKTSKSSLRMHSKGIVTSLKSNNVI